MAHQSLANAAAAAAAATELLFKIVVVGNAGVGKTRLVRQFASGDGAAAALQGATIGVDFMLKTLDVSGARVKLQLWDTAGQERFRSITQSYYRSAHCLVLVYDVSSQPSFDALRRWLADTRAALDGARPPHARRALYALVGNKSDVATREVPTNIGARFAAANNFELFAETSALDARSVNALFMNIAEQLAEAAAAAAADSASSSAAAANEVGVAAGERVSLTRAAFGELSGEGVRSALASRAKSCAQC